MSKSRSQSQDYRGQGFGGLRSKEAPAQDTQS